MEVLLEINLTSLQDDVDRISNWFVMYVINESMQGMHSKDPRQGDAVGSCGKFLDNLATGNLDSISHDVIGCYSTDTAQSMECAVCLKRWGQATSVIGEIHVHVWKVSKEVCRLHRAGVAVEWLTKM